MTRYDMLGGLAAAEPRTLVDEIEAQGQRILLDHGGSPMTWRVWGKGPPLVLLHGSHGSWTHWVRNVLPLSEQFTVLVPDLAGNGDSAGVSVSHIDEMAQILSDDLRALGVTGPYLLCGFSLGSVIAMHLLHHDAARVSRLVIAGHAGLGPFDPVGDRLMRWRGVQDPEVLREIHRHNLALLMIAKEESIDELSLHVQARNNESVRLDPCILARTAKGRKALEMWRPCLTLIWGSEDRLVRRYLDANIEVMRGIDPTARVHVIPGSGHWVQFEDAEVFNAILLGIAGEAGGQYGAQ